jgi:hypothetical protein
MTFIIPGISTVMTVTGIDQRCGYAQALISDYTSPSPLPFPRR